MSTNKPIVITSKLKIKGFNNNSKKRKLDSQIDNKLNNQIDSKIDSHIDSKIDNNVDSTVDSKDDSKEDGLYSGLTEVQRKHKLRLLENQRRNIDSIVKKSYRDRIDEYNNKLSSMTEHNDVPKVSAAGNG
mmetsp:Transcript_5625/g.5057  ORF Transcript_5625/g.5057 Transcript_5625/m.5057 type:complete len:131 (+) Transcript_5625:30-422(+)